MLGTVLDGIPESMVIGLTIYEGGAVGAAYLAAVFISNLPEAISSTAGLVTGGWKKARILWMWIAIAVVSGVASLAGYGLFQNSSPDTVAFVLAFAAGAILTMLADTMMPEAFEHGGKLVGVVTTLGFAVAFTIHRSTESAEAPVNPSINAPELPHETRLERRLDAALARATTPRGGRHRDRHRVDRDRPRGRPPDDGRRPRQLSVDRIRALVGRPDGRRRSATATTFRRLSPDGSSPRS